MVRPFALRLSIISLMITIAVACTKTSDSVTLGISDGNATSQKAFGFVMVRNKLPLDVEKIATDGNADLYWAVNAVQMGQFAYVECLATESMPASAWMLMLESAALVDGVQIDADRRIALVGSERGASETNTPCTVIGNRLISYPVAKRFFSHLEAAASPTLEDVKAAQAFYLALRAFDKKSERGTASPSFKLLQDIASEHESLNGDQADAMIKTILSYDRDLNPCSAEQPSARFQAAWRGATYKCVPLNNDSQGNVSAYALNDPSSYPAIRNALIASVSKNHAVAYGTVSDASSNRDRLWNLLTRAGSLRDVKQGDADYDFAQALLDPNGAKAFKAAMADAGGPGLTGFALDNRGGRQARGGNCPVSPNGQRGSRRGIAAQGVGNDQRSVEQRDKLVDEMKQRSTSTRSITKASTDAEKDALAIELAEARFLGENASENRRGTANDRAKALAQQLKDAGAEGMDVYKVDGQVGDQLRLVRTVKNRAGNEVKEWTFSDPVTREEGTRIGDKSVRTVKEQQRWREASNGQDQLLKDSRSAAGTKVYVDVASAETEAAGEKDRTVGRTFTNVQTVDAGGKSGSYGFIVDNEKRDAAAHKSLFVDTKIEGGRHVIEPTKDNLNRVLDFKNSQYDDALKKQKELCETFTANKAKADDVTAKQNAVKSAETELAELKKSNPGDGENIRALEQKVDEAKKAVPADAEATKAKIAEENKKIEEQFAVVKQEAAEVKERADALEREAKDATAAEKEALAKKDAAGDDTFKKIQSAQLGGCKGGTTGPAATLMLDDADCLSGGATPDATASTTPTPDASGQPTADASAQPTPTASTEPNPAVQDSPFNTETTPTATASTQPDPTATTADPTTADATAQTATPAATVDPATPTEPTVTQVDTTNVDPFQTIDPTFSSTTPTADTGATTTAAPTANDALFNDSFNTAGTYGDASADYDFYGDGYSNALTTSPDFASSAGTGTIDTGSTMSADVSSTSSNTGLFGDFAQPTYSDTSASSYDYGSYSSNDFSYSDYSNTAASYDQMTYNDQSTYNQGANQGYDQGASQGYDPGTTSAAPVEDYSGYALDGAEPEKK